jgi:hypothetical protein
MSDTSLLKAVAALKTAMGALEKALSERSAEKPVKAPKVKAVKASKAPKVKAAKAPSTLKEHAQAAIEAGKFHHKSKAAATLKAYLDDTATDLRSKEGREMSAQVAEMLGLPGPKKPGRVPKAEATPKVKTAKTEAPKAGKKKSGPKGAKATPKAVGLKLQAEAALEAKKFSPKATATLKAFVESTVDGRSQEGRTAAIEVCEILGLPPPKKPGPAPKAEKTPKAAKAASDAPKVDGRSKAARAAKAGKAPATEAAATPKVDGRSKAARAAKAAAISGKGEADSASETSRPSPTKRTAAMPRTIEAIKVVLGSGSMNVGELIVALEEKGWLPESQDIKSHLGFIFSKNQDIFEKDSSKPKGYFRLKGSVSEPAAVTNGSNGSNKQAASVEEDVEGDLPEATDDEEPFDKSILGPGDTILGID